MNDICHNLKHLAIIMDGNTRWAKNNNLQTNIAYKKGGENILNLIENCLELKIFEVSIFAFSSENMNRSKQEIKFLFSLANYMIEHKMPQIHAKKAKINFVGNFENLPDKLKIQIQNINTATNHYKDIKINIAFNYGGKWDIITGCKNICKKALNKQISINDIDYKIFKNNMPSKSINDIDLCIRTSGENRISNFLLWQLTYSELYFTKTLWPDFNKEHLIEAIKDFNKRTRNYGKH